MRLEVKLSSLVTLRNRRWFRSEANAVNETEVVNQRKNRLTITEEITLNSKRAKFKRKKVGRNNKNVEVSERSGERNKIKLESGVQPLKAARDKERTSRTEQINTSVRVDK